MTKDAQQSEEIMIPSLAGTTWLASAHLNIGYVTQVEKWDSMHHSHEVSTSGGGATVYGNQAYAHPVHVSSSSYAWSERNSKVFVDFGGKNNYYVIKGKDTSFQPGDPFGLMIYSSGPTVRAQAAYVDVQRNEFFNVISAEDFITKEMGLVPVSFWNEGGVTVLVAMATVGLGWIGFAFQKNSMYPNVFGVLIGAALLTIGLYSFRLFTYYRARRILVRDDLLEAAAKRLVKSAYAALGNARRQG